MNGNKFLRGFTLIELIVVMAIFSILAVIVTGTFVSSSRRGRDARRKNDLRAVAGALELYYSDKGKYPSSNANGQMVGYCASSNSSCTDSTIIAWSSKDFQDPIPSGALYMNLVPTDPSIYRYFYVSTGTTYKLYAKLENTLDSGSGVMQNPPGYPGTNCSASDTVLCTYGISSLDTNP